MSAQLVSQYAAASISTNLYVVSQPWLFSLAWCCGVHTVTTNAPQLLSGMSAPHFLMTPDDFALMWILTDVSSVLLVVLVLVFHWWLKRAIAFCSGGTAMLDNGTYSKFKTEMNDIWSVASANSPTEKTSPSTDDQHGTAEAPRRQRAAIPRGNEMYSF